MILVTDRLVESSRMKRALESAFTVILPKGASPFIYLRSATFFLPLEIAGLIT